MKARRTPRGPWWPTWNPASGWMVTNGDFLLGQHLADPARNGFRGYGARYATLEAAQRGAARQNWREGWEACSADTPGAFCPLTGYPIAAVLRRHEAARRLA